MLVAFAVVIVKLLSNMFCFPFGLHLQKYKKISKISLFFLFFFEKMLKKFVYKEYSRFFAHYMTAHAFNLNSAPRMSSSFLNQII